MTLERFDGTREHARRLGLHESRDKNGKTVWLVGAIDAYGKLHFASVVHVGEEIEGATSASDRATLDEGVAMDPSVPNGSASELNDPSDRDDPRNYDEYGNRNLDAAGIKDLRAQIEYLTAGSESAVAGSGAKSKRPATLEEHRKAIAGMAHVSSLNFHSRLAAQEERKANWEHTAAKRREAEDRELGLWAERNAAHTGRKLISGLIAAITFVLSGVTYSAENVLPSAALFVVSAIFAWRFLTAKSPGGPPPKRGRQP
jgi:hypothetical protein